MRCVLLPILATCLASSLVDCSHVSASAENQLELKNDRIRCVWHAVGNQFKSLTVTNCLTEQVLNSSRGLLPQVVLDNRQIIDLAKLAAIESIRVEPVEADPTTASAHWHDTGHCLTARFQDQETSLELTWSVELRDGANYVVQSLQMTAKEDTRIAEIVFVDERIDSAQQIGQVDGSVIACDHLFLAVEHPLAKNIVDADARVRCALPRRTVLKAGQTWQYSMVVGVVKPGQRRRDFLAYLERRRAHPYRPFLHYNSWYHLNIGRPDNHMTESECLDTIEFFGRELIQRRQVVLDAFVWDDGWDNFNSLWQFHSDFPNEFKKLNEAGVQYGAAQGVWISPWGGYGGPKQKRIAYGHSQGYETNSKGFSMAGPKYRAAFRDVCLKMMRDNGVIFFKFDGMGGGGGSTGPTGELADDVDAVLNLTRELRREQPDLFISATVGTWSSPFWTLYADSIWRQGGDTGFYGPGNGRQRWITYRDMNCYHYIVQWGPLYPLNSLMLHGPCIGERANPARMDRDEASVADEIWTFFGSGTDLQELYISPHLLTPTMWDELAAAAKWSRANHDILIDTHWIGGDPARGEVYGWAAWAPRGGTITLRNPSDTPNAFEFVLSRDWELPANQLETYDLKPVRSDQRIGRRRVTASETVRLEFEPFEVLVFQGIPVTSAGQASETPMNEDGHAD